MRNQKPDFYMNLISKYNSEMFQCLSVKPAGLDHSIYNHTCSQCDILHMYFILFSVLPISYYKTNSTKVGVVCFVPCCTARVWKSSQQTVGIQSIFIKWTHEWSCKMATACCCQSEICVQFQESQTGEVTPSMVQWEREETGCFVLFVFNGRFLIHFCTCQTWSIIR